MPNTYYVLHDTSFIKSTAQTILENPNHKVLKAINLYSVIIFFVSAIHFSWNKNADDSSI